MYCDDTSGNMSKKWNKHNSWLFTPAGLPQEIGQQEGNVHFLVTLNLAPPLEMLDGIVSQLEHGQAEGIWAWDIELQEMVLVVPAVLAILGDNPMQSELACHVGLAGKFFCWNCWVKGRDAADRQKDTGDASDSDLSSIHSFSTQSDNSSQADTDSTHPRKGRKETMQQLVDHAKRFLDMSEHSLCRKDETMHHLEHIFREASVVSGYSRAKQMKTSTGLKDTFQDTFIEQIKTFASKLRGPTEEKQRAVDAMIAQELPGNTMSPVWRIEDLDPNQDTPVEILHVVLLGFIKYFWRDVISRLSKTKKELLKVCLSSADVSGLGITPLSGETLVIRSGVAYYEPGERYQSLPAVYGALDTPVVQQT
ncbi:uncharacterized protein B0H18DRAFT_950971 [Fomitopsis serialis]|uniref:uncharacterized protein n=1 Tax=Fomitopsis serialis TaxID=139415 RepID=UPI0020078BE4|nr:uncharacterized protein B0H18DRAFT_950971 [Neoantrodia serialis]KAH9935417.1 hypothetical protein B0H18DRAFT_950971 [Neoantrodia serialis]